MRTLGGLKAAVLLVVLSLGLASAGEPAAAGKVDFTAQMRQTRGLTTLNGVFFATADKTRLDLLTPQGLISTVTRLDRKLMWIINHDQRSYLEMKGMAVNPLSVSETEREGQARQEDLGTEKIEGYDCRKIKYTFLDKSKGVVVEWMADSLGYPLRTLFHGPEGEVVLTEFKKVKVGPQDPGLFEIPEGFSRVARPGSEPAG